MTARTGRPVGRPANPNKQPKKIVSIYIMEKTERWLRKKADFNGEGIGAVIDRLVKEEKANATHSAKS